MTRYEFNKNKIESIDDIGLKTLVYALYRLKGNDGIRIVQQAINMVSVNPVEVDGWLGDKSIKELKQIDNKILNEAIGIVLEQISEKKEHNLSDTSLKRLAGVQHDIVRVVKRASLYENIFVVEGMRSQKRQNKLKRKGKSQISRSYHLYGLAVDLVMLVNGKIDWNSKKSYKKIHKAINRAEKELGLNVLENAMFDLHWRTLTDYPHWQMNSRYVPNRNPRKFYAKNKGIGFA